jgi:hypothetical protein
MADGGGSSGETHGARYAWSFAASALCVCLPFMFVRYVPAADLPQHLAQVRLLGELFGRLPATSDLSLLTVQWWAPNTLVYAPLFALCELFEPVLAGRACVTLLLVAQVAVIHRIGSLRGLPLPSLWLASGLVYSAALVWGFLNFLCAVPLFVLLVDYAVHPAQREERSRSWEAAVVLALLYVAHVLLCAAGVAVVVASALLRRGWPLRRRLGWLLPVVPVGLLALAYVPAMAGRRATAGFDLGLHYFATPLERLLPGELATVLAGAVRFRWSQLWVLPAAAYIAAALLARRRDEVWRGRALASIGGLIIALALVIPDQWLTTIRLPERFGAIGLTLLVTGLPRPRLRPALGAALAGGIAALACAGTTAAFVAFERFELSGLDEALAAIPGPARSIGLAYQPVSALVTGRPYIHAVAYAVASRGGESDFSFAEHGTTIVAYKAPRRATWQRGTEWLPERATRRDVQAFDFALVSGTDDDHARFVAMSGARALTRTGKFRLYQPR